eukprot:scaffold21327_cov66-Phaeocystis_antarctica.AAC.1
MVRLPSEKLPMRLPLWPVTSSRVFAMPNFFFSGSVSSTTSPFPSRSALKETTSEPPSTSFFLETEVTVSSPSVVELRVVELRVVGDTLPEDLPEYLDDVDRRCDTRDTYLYGNGEGEKKNLPWFRAARACGIGPGGDWVVR